MTINGHKLSDRESCDYTKKKTTFQGICTCADSFLFENFKGAVSISIGETPPAYTLIASEGFALFFKLLLTKIYGASVLSIEFGSEKKSEMFVRCRWHDVKADEDFVKRLSFISEKSGFELNYEELDTSYCITLRIKEDKSVLLALYAISKREIFTAFNLIFYT